MNNRNIMVLLGAAALSLSGLMTADANPLAVEDLGISLSATTNAIENRVEMEAAANGLMKCLGDLEMLMTKSSTKNVGTVFIYRAGTCYSLDFSKIKRRYGRLSVMNFEYCKDDLYLIDGQIVSGTMLMTRISEACFRMQRENWKANKMNGDNSQDGHSLSVYCLKVGSKKFALRERSRRNLFLDDVDF